MSCFALVFSVCGCTVFSPLVCLFVCSDLLHVIYSGTRCGVSVRSEYFGVQGRHHEMRLTRACQCKQIRFSADNYFHGEQIMVRL